MTLTWILIAIVTLIAIRVFLWNYVSASSDDWYVAFDIDESDKTVLVWFLPIVAFRIYKGEANPISSNSKYLSKIIHQQKDSKSIANASQYSYGRWVRDNCLIEEIGIPDTDETFTGHIAGYVAAGYRVSIASSIPLKYSKLLSEALDDANVREKTN